MEIQKFLNCEVHNKISQFETKTINSSSHKVTSLHADVIHSTCKHRIKHRV